MTRCVSPVSWMDVLQSRVWMLVDRHGSLRAAGKVLDIDPAYLKKLMDGSETNPSDAVLKKLHLERIVTYKLRSLP